MPDPIFADPRLARVYDAFDADRSDLDVYARIVDELGARVVADVGCGTGCLALLLGGRGIQVIGCDPAEASLAVARAKPGAEAVTWLDGDARVLPPASVDLVVMTGNVAQVFLTDDTWLSTLFAAHRALRAGGYLVFETRVPGRRAWEDWQRDATDIEVDVPGIGRVHQSFELTEVALPLVSFRFTYRFEVGGAELVSESVLRFRDRGDITRDLARAGFRTLEVREAPDRPGLEHVFVTQRDV